MKFRIEPSCHAGGGYHGVAVSFTSNLDINITGIGNQEKPYIFKAKSLDTQQYHTVVISDSEDYIILRKCFLYGIKILNSNNVILKDDINIVRLELTNCSNYDVKEKDLASLVITKCAKLKLDNIRCFRLDLNGCTDVTISGLEDKGYLSHLKLKSCSNITIQNSLIHKLKNWGSKNITIKDTRIKKISKKASLGPIKFENVTVLSKKSLERVKDKLN